MDPATIAAAVELAFNVAKNGIALYEQIRAAQESNDPVALQAILDKLEAANDALMAS